MVNPFKEVDWNPDLAARRLFAKSLVIGFPIIAVIFLLILRINTGAWETKVPLLIFGCGTGAGLLFWFLPQVSKPFYIIWYSLACAIGLVFGNLLLGVVYYLLITGLGLGMKLAKRDSLNRNFDRNKKTYWLDVKQPDNAKRYFNQY